MAVLLSRVPDTLTGKRDKALLALGFAGAFRRSELVAIECRGFARGSRRLRVIVRRSKVDQEGEGFEKAIPHGRFIYSRCSSSANGLMRRASCRVRCSAGVSVGAVRGQSKSGSSKLRWANGLS